ncbi:MAG: sigma-54-dependent Fis family transcriptional regulator [bacterium]
MEALSLKKFFSKKENLALLDTIIGLAGESTSVLDNAGNLISGVQPAKKNSSYPIKIEGKTVGQVSGKAAAENIAFILSYITEARSMERSLADEVLKKYKESHLLYNISDRIALCTEQADIANYIIRDLAMIIKFERASIIAHNEISNVFEILAFYDDGSHDEAAFKNQAGQIEKINGKVFKSGRGEIINNIILNNTRSSYSLMSAPLKTKENIIGVINVFSFKGIQYTASDFKLFSAIASYTANSIEITRLYNAEKERVKELQKKNEEISAAKEIVVNENINLKQNLRQKFSPKKILGISEPIKQILDKIDKIADIPSNVLITGESGTGKELVAKAVHYSGNRADKPFIAINCSAIPESIFESELFGIEKGIATGVDKRKGKILEADNGTLFLDEIGDMPLAGQAKILRIIQDREVVPIGGSSPIRFNVRIIAATNKDLRKEIAKGNFREDLFYRLNVVSLEIPSLRERKDDIPILINYFLKITALKLGRQDIKCSPEAVRALTNYDWPGNIRELENEIERAVALSISGNITRGDLSGNILRSGQQRDNNAPERRIMSIEEHEISVVRKALESSNWNKTAAAKILGISREGLRKKMIKLGI